MRKYEAIEIGIKGNDIRVLREAIGNICYTSRNFSSGEFDEAIRYVESYGIKLKDERLVGDPPISSQKSTFTDDDFADAIFELKENFCDERIRDVKTIGKALYGNSSEEAKPRNNTQNTPIQKTSYGTDPNVSSHQTSNRGIVIGLVAVVVVLIIALLLLKN